MKDMVKWFKGLPLYAKIILPVFYIVITMGSFVLGLAGPAMVYYLKDELLPSISTNISFIDDGSGLGLIQTQDSYANPPDYRELYKEVSDLEDSYLQAINDLFTGTVLSGVNGTKIQSTLSCGEISASDSTYTDYNRTYENRSSSESCKLNDKYMLTVDMYYDVDTSDIDYGDISIYSYMVSDALDKYARDMGDDRLDYVEIYWYSYDDSRSKNSYNFAHYTFDKYDSFMVLDDFKIHDD